jgi:hypothetical protein
MSWNSDDNVSYIDDDDLVDETGRYPIKHCIANFSLFADRSET